jgi:hypothetical protein
MTISDAHVFLSAVSVSRSEALKESKDPYMRNRSVRLWDFSSIETGMLFKRSARREPAS